jgi:protein-L-isoaspartate(D-aspartate) O-methyltransferase
MDTADARRRYAAAIMGQTGAANPRVEAAFTAVPRERYLTPPPWRIFAPGGLFDKVTADPADLYDDVLVVLDPRKGINNGQPSLHAAWMAAVDPRPGETALHVGIGAGYYTAILAHLVEPGEVHAYEIDLPLAERAAQNLAGLANVSVHPGSGVAVDLPAAQVVYVNAGAAAPDLAWLRALQPGGRLVFPWQPTPGGGVTLVVTRTERGFAADPSMAVGFIPCVGAPGRAERIGRRDPWATRSLWLTAERAPDETATAAFEHVWFSRDPV